MVTTLSIRKIIFIMISVLSFCSLYSQELIPFQNQLNGLWGYKNNSGNVVINSIFQSARNFHDSIACVTYENQDNSSIDSLYIDENGKTIFNGHGANLDDFSCGYGLGCENWNYFFYVNKKGVRSKNYRGLAFSFSENYAILYDDKSYHIIDTKFNIVAVLPFTFDQGYKMSKYGFGVFHSGLTPIKNISDKWGYMDIHGQVKIGLEYDWVSRFFENYALVFNNIKKQWNLIDQNGNIVASYVAQDNHYSMIQNYLEQSVVDQILENNLENINNPDNLQNKLINIMDKIDESLNK